MSFAAACNCPAYFWRLADRATFLKFTLDEGWHEISPYLDEVLDLDAPARQEWLDLLAKRAPEIAARVRTYLVEMDNLDKQRFLDIPAALVTGSTLAGQRFGAYTLDRELGHGGTGTVWLAHRSDGQFEGKAAVKLLSAALVGHPSAQRFAREASMLARLQHPNVAHLLDASVEGGSQPYLVLEYVRGEHIDRFCEARSLGINERIRLFLDVLGAVAHAHSNLIVHRDLKPSNILVTEEGTVKLLDFGIAALLVPSAASALLTRNAPAGHTPGYAAPEQLLGEAVTTATDVYALGLVLFMLLAGRHPLPSGGKAVAELMRLTLDTDMPRPSEIATDNAHQRLLRGDLDNIIATALRRNPAERYSTVNELAQDLRHYLALEPISARPRSLRYLAAMFIRRHRAAVASAVGIVIVLLAATIVTTLQMVEARRQRDESTYQSLRAEASNDFLNVLMQSDAGSARPTLSYFQRLELGVDLLHKQYRDDPRFAGRMLVDLADDFRDNDETRRANELYAEASDIGRRAQDVELVVRAQCGRAYAEAFADIREGVLERLGEARLLLTRLSAPDPSVQADCLRAQARFEQRRGNTGSAESLLREAMRIMEASGSTHRQTYVAVLTDLGDVYLARNQPREVLRIAQLAGDVHDRNGRGGTAARLVSRQNAAVALSAMGETRAALAEREIINQRVRELESSGEEPFPYAINYATLLVRMGKADAALHALDGVVERVRPTQNRSILTQSLLTKGSTFIQSGRWDAADAALQEAASLATAGIGNRSAAAQVESLMARLDLARGDLEAARRHGDRSLELAGYRTPKPERPLARLLLVASQIALTQKAGADAERFALDALAIVEPIARGPDTSADVGEALLRLSQARMLSGARSPDTKVMLERAARCLTNGLAPDHPLTIEARNLLSTPSA
jgi:serine/threonine protein kinase